MTLFEKLRFAFLPYLQFRGIYSASEKASADLNKYYWLDGNSYNIITKKWRVENGISLGLYTHALDAPLIKRVNITGLCEYGFGLAELDREDELHVIVDFIAKHIHTENFNQQFEFSFWEPAFRHDEQCYFIDGMGQGQMLSLITRYNLLFPERANNELIARISNSYLVDFDHPHGFVSRQGREVILEEYSRPLPCNHVLNGWIYSLTGLFDYVNYCEKTNLRDQRLAEKKAVLNDTIETLERSLKFYDLGYWSTYHQPNIAANIGSIHYQVTHIAQLGSLYKMTSRKTFLEYSRKFRAQYRNPLFRLLALFNKIVMANILKKGHIFRSK